MNLCEDFFTIVFQGLITSGAMAVLKLTDLEHWPNDIDQNAWLLDKTQRQLLMDKILSDIVENIMDIRFHSTAKCTGNDKVLQYAKQLLSMGSIHAEFADAIRERDGDRVLRCWRYLMVIYHNSSRNNYAKEAVLLLHQYHHELSDQLCERLLYSRFVNVKGQEGTNVSLDLHMEHLNRILKGGIHALSSNKSTDAIITLGKAMGTLEPVLESFDRDNNVRHHETHHRQRIFLHEVSKIVRCIQEFNMFEKTPDRSYTSFPNPKSLIHKSSLANLKEWIQTHLPE